MNCRFWKKCYFLGNLHLEEWAEFFHKKDQLYKDWDEVRKEIEEQTDLQAGSGKSISPEPINLKVYSSRVVNLTVVDLPGLTKVRVPVIIAY